MFRTLTVMIIALLIACSGRGASFIDETKIQLTAEEQQYVARHRVITWALEENRPPFVYVEGGKIKGISIAYLDAISKKTGLIFKPQPVANFADGLNAVIEGQVDIMTSMRPTGERAVHLGFTPPFAYNAGVFLFRLNSQPRSPLRAGIEQGDAALIYLSQRFPDMKIIQAADNEEVISLLEKGLLDVAVMNEASADYLSRKSIIKMRKASVDFDYPYSFGFKKENAILGSILSKALASIKIEDKKAINEAWVKE